MKPKAAEIARILSAPDPGRPGLLIHGRDPMRVAMRRAQAVTAAVGTDAADEMRLTRISGADLRRDPAQLVDALKAVGFFPGPTAVLVEDATDGLASVLGAALDAWQMGDGTIIATAGALAKSSALRKLFEGHRTAVALPVYDDPPGEAEITGWLAEAELANLPREAMGDLVALSKALDPGDFRQTIEKIGLYKHGDAAPLTSAEIAMLAPQTSEAAIDGLIDLVAEGRGHELGAMMGRVAAQGTQPVTLCIAALRHFRALHGVASDPGGVQAGLGRLRPPVFGPRRDRMARQAQIWGVMALEDAVHRLLETDLALRSSTRAPAMPLVERALIRIAMMPRARR